jgi:hypothetical protein
MAAWLWLPPSPLPVRNLKDPGFEDLMTYVLCDLHLAEISHKM